MQSEIQIKIETTVTRVSHLNNWSFYLYLYLVNKNLPTINRDKLIKILLIILRHFGQGVADSQHKRRTR